MKISIIYNKNATHIQTVNDHMMSFQKYSKHEINYIDQTDFDNINKIHSDLVVLHYSIMHSVAWGLTKYINIIKAKEENSSENYKKILNNKAHWISIEIKNSLCLHLTNFLLNYNGIKIAFIQDEYYDTNLTKMFLEIINVNTVFTCIPKEHISKIYSNLNNTGFIHNITGYVSECDLKIIPIKERKCDVFYRGRELHYKYGDLGQDKMNIGKFMAKCCSEYNLIFNIDCNGANSIYGDEWFKVLGNSKVTLATESGSTIFDLDNSLLTEINVLLGELPLQNGYTKPPIYTYEDVCNKINFKKVEVKNMGQVSPKMFEAITLGTVLIMYEGFYYPGFLLPDVHYIVLKKDHSNIQEVINKIKDDDFLQKMADKAYDDIIRSDKYSYKKFIEMFDKEVENPYIYKPTYNANATLEWYKQTKYMNKKVIVDNIINHKLSNKYDAVIMLTWSNWETEARSNRYHYATRFSKELPVYFLQCNKSNNENIIIRNIDGINIIKMTTTLKDDKLIACKKCTKIELGTSTFPGIIENCESCDVDFVLNEFRNQNVKNPLFWVYNPHHYTKILDHFPNSTLIYHGTENYFYNSATLPLMDYTRSSIINLFSRTNLLVGVSESLINSYKNNGNYKGDSILIENGCDAEFYINIKNKLEYKNNDKIVIYQGGINKRIDFILLKDIINKLPDWEFWFCGGEDTTIDIWKELKNLSQVKYYGILQPNQIGELMSKSTVGIIPYVQDEIIYASFPLKSFEYVSCGLPVVTIPIKSLEDKNKEYNVFQVASTAEDFSKEIEKGYNTRNDKTKLDLRELSSLQNSYNIRFKCVKDKIWSM